MPRCGEGELLRTGAVLDRPGRSIDLVSCPFVSRARNRRVRFPLGLTAILRSRAADRAYACVACLASWPLALPSSVPHYL